MLGTPIRPEDAALTVIRNNDQDAEQRMYLEIASAIARALPNFSASYPERVRLTRTLTRLRRLAPTGPEPRL